jgi:hypothetical protein
MLLTKEYMLRIISVTLCIKSEPIASGCVAPYSVQYLSNQVSDHQAALSAVLAYVKY